MPIINPNSISREEYLRRKRKKKLIRYYILFGIFVLAIALFSYISYRPSLRINDVTLAGGVLVNQKDVSEATSDFLKGSYFFLFPKDNTFIYPKYKLENYLKDKFKRIETISVSIGTLNTLRIEISERNPIALWCKKNIFIGTTTPEGFKEESCYFIDSESTIFASAPDFSGDAYFKYYGLVENQNPIGERYIASTTVFYKINSFIDKMKNLNLKPAVLISKGEDEFSIRLLSGGEVYIDTKKSLDESFVNLATLLDSDEFKNFNKSNLPINYIDLRYGNKLYYKLR